MLREVSLCMHAVTLTPVEPLELSRSKASQRRRPSPCDWRVGFHIVVFEACSVFTRVTAYMLAGSPLRPFYTEGFDGFVTSTAAPITTGWSDQLPGGNCTR